jgi:hypothetical protein
MPISTPKTAAMMPIMAPNKPMIKPKSPAPIPIQMGKVRIRMMAISTGDEEDEEDDRGIGRLFAEGKQKPFYSTKPLKNCPQAVLNVRTVK